LWKEFFDRTAGFHSTDRLGHILFQPYFDHPHHHHRTSSSSSSSSTAADGMSMVVDPPGEEFLWWLKDVCFVDDRAMSDVTSTIVEPTLEELFGDWPLEPEP
jgi:hypothetical protein